MAKSATEMVKEAKAVIENLGVEEVAAEIEQGALLVDVREPEELAKNGRIPGSIHAPRGMLEFYADESLPYHKKELDKSKRIILHCASGGRSALACKMLREMGYERTAHLDGGFNAWRAAGKPVEGGAS